MVHKMSLLLQYFLPIVLSKAVHSKQDSAVKMYCRASMMNGADAEGWMDGHTRMGLFKARLQSNVKILHWARLGGCILPAGWLSFSFCHSSCTVALVNSHGCQHPLLFTDPGCEPVQCKLNAPWLWALSMCFSETKAWGAFKRIMWQGAVGANDYIKLGLKKKKFGCDLPFHWPPSYHLEHFKPFPWMKYRN